MSRTYDNHLRVASESVNGAHTVTYGYDDDGLLTRAGALQIARDPQNGFITGTTLGGITDTYEYNEHGELERYTARHGETVLYDVAYVWDDLGRVSQRTETVFGTDPRALEYRYDDADRLAQVIERPSGVLVASYSYDANGNRLTASTVFGEATGTYNARDQMVSYGGASYSYSPRGSVETRADGSGTTSYDFDGRGALSAVTLPDGRRVSFVFDAAHVRVGKRVDGGLVQRRLYGSALEVLADLDASGGVESRYVFVNRLGSAAYMVRGGHTYRIVSDMLGSAHLVVDVETGEIVQRLDYDEWGNVLSDSNPGFQPFAFTGRELDAETGLYYLRARYYDPRAGRFISADPIGLAGGVNRHEYVGNSPLARLDPVGSDWIDSAANGVAGFGDALTFGQATNLGDFIADQWSDIAGWNEGAGGVDRCSTAYKLGEWSGVAMGVAITGGSAALKSLAAGASRQAVRNAARPFVARVPGSGGFVHHGLPLFGHPGGASAMFPVGGLPPSVHSGAWNLTRLATQGAHTAAHQSLRRSEAIVGGLFHPAATAGRAVKATMDGCGCP